jgi:uncharacterized protein
MHRIPAALATLIAALFAMPAQAASFDCARARSADEVTVCRTPTLSALDSEMGGLWYAWSRVPMLMGGNGNRGDEARAFLDARRRCASNIGCLGTIYRARIAELHHSLDAAMAEYFRLLHGN